MKLVALTSQIRVMSGEGPVEVDLPALAHDVMDYLAKIIQTLTMGCLNT